MPASIKDVARLACVSTSTASNILNNKGYASDDTRKKVLLAAKKLNYKPNALARGLVTGASKTVGVLIPDLSDPYFTEIVRGVDECARENEYSVILCNTDRDIFKERFYFKNLNERRVDGIIFSGSGREDDRYTVEEEDLSSVVVIGNHNTAFSTCQVDNVQAADDITTFLLERNHKRIGLISGPLEYMISTDRLKGYQRALLNRGIPYDPMLVIEENFKETAGQRAAEKLLRLPEELRPTAIIAQNDQMAVGAISAAWIIGLQIPKDVAIVGFDDIPIASLTCPPLTTVRLPMHQMGYNAMSMIIEGKKELEFKKKKMVMQHEIIVRGTT